MAADRRGIAAAEFALVAPVMLLLLLASTDLILWVRGWLQVTRAASEVSQVIGQYTQLHEADFTGTFYPMAQNIAGSTPLQCDPVNTPNNNVVISGITTSSSNSTITSTVTWQRAWGTDKRCIASTIGQQGKTATLPTGYVPPVGLPLIVVEVWATQSAFVLSKALPFMNWTGPSSVRSYAIVTPRNGVLSSVLP